MSEGLACEHGRLPAACGDCHNAELEIQLKEMVSALTYIMNNPDKEPGLIADNALDWLDKR